MDRLTLVSHHVAELVNLPPQPADPFVGASAFAHKGGLHTSALGRAGGATYEHIDPELVGNHTRVLVSDLGGKAGMAMKAEEFGVQLDDQAVAALSEELKHLESRGWLFEAADASLELLMLRATGWRQSFFDVEAYREGPVMPVGEVEIATEATIKLWIGDERIAAVGEGNGPVNALDNALREALNGRYPALERIHLTDYKVRVLDSVAATGSVVRVLIVSTDGDTSWTTVGVSENIIEASWQALCDSIVHGLLHAGAGT
jgi:2-isopropylmalate synthase